MGLVQSLDYGLSPPNSFHRAMWHLSASRPGSWIFARLLPPVDRTLFGWSGGRLTVPGLLAGLPVLTVVTRGARSGVARTTPLVGVPVGDDVAVIGTHFGQAGTPSWYYNLRAHPSLEVSYRDNHVAATAREVALGGEEWRSIWELGRQIYGGYEAYARRIRDRPIHIMVFSTEITLLTPATPPTPTVSRRRPPGRP
jgi:deazaflavin-dependent oxidoreductase (nitroreductase family)